MKAHELLDPDFKSFLTPGAEAWTLETLPAIRSVSMRHSNPQNKRAVKAY
ncbi:hypothetical protein LJU32_16170 [Pseudomonas sp. B21_DOA]|nr:hypothetical protein LJU32_16170 [Pseudomonas sp. B21_DOA]